MMHVCIFISKTPSREIIGLVDHCESVKELLEFLDFLYPGKEQVHRMFEVCMQFFSAKRKVSFSPATLAP